MKITQGYIALTANNKYLYIYSHKNGIIEINPVSNIYDATIRQKPGARDGKEAQQLARYNVTWIPVTIETKLIPGAI